MSISIGKYITQKLRSKGIYNKIAAKHIGLSESAFEKVLTQDDIYTSRLLKLSQLLQENLFAFYNDQEPLKTLINEKEQERNAQIDSLKEKIADQNLIIFNQTEVIRLLLEKEQSKS